MKRYMMILGTVFFLVMFFSLHLMMETVTSTKPSELDAQALDSIEMKIKRIENDIVRNHETIRSIKDLIRQLNQGDKASLAKLQNLLNVEKDRDGGGAQFSKGGQAGEGQGKVETMHVKPVTPPTPLGAGLAERTEEKTQFIFRPRLNMPEGMCGFAENPAATADVQMWDVYEELPFDNPDGGVWKQGWEITYNINQWQDSKLKVFVVPHSHTDPGWVKTFQDYYHQQTRFIFDNMLDMLERYPKMRFIYAEMSFFSIWWDEIDAPKRTRVKKLLDKGQLEIVTGGWVMNDEANTHYFAMVDQMIEGHQWLLHSLGVKPKAGWSIDPFGLTPTMAYLLKRMGLHNMLIQRVHYAVKKHLAKAKSLEFMWRQTWDPKGSADILCHTMPFYSYDVPHTCGPDPKVCCQFDFRRLPGSKHSCPWKINPVPITPDNVHERSLTLLDQYRKKAQLYRTNVLLVPLGDDFRYDKADEWEKQYENYQAIFDYVNSKSELNAQVQFGTLSDYFTAVYKETETKPGMAPEGMPVLSGDFFTYSDREDHYWSGYYTSRPFYKRLDRMMESHLRSAEIIYTLALAYAAKHTSASFPTVDLFHRLIEARQNLALFQHHDGITGTAKDFVVVDYGQRLLKALLDSKEIIRESATFLLTTDKTKYSPSAKEPVFQLDDMMATHDSLPVRNTMTVDSTPRSFVLVNSLGQRRVQVVSLMVYGCHLEVRDAENVVIHSQASPVWLSQQELDMERCEVWFVAEVPALGLARYTIRQVAAHSNSKHHLAQVTLHNGGGFTGSKDLPFKVSHVSEPSDFSIETNFLKADFLGHTGMLKAVTSKVDGTTHRAEMEFVQYGVKQAKEKSGAYLFLPSGHAEPIPLASPWMQVVRGPLMSEVRVFTQFVEHVVRLHNSPGPDSAGVEVYNIVDIRTGVVNKEIAMRISTDIQNEDKVFYTDLNGFMMHRRKSYEKLPLQANYFPMTSMMFLEDAKARFSVLTGQSLGCASLESGVAEIMMDRRLNQDDNRGLGQGVMDNKRTPNFFRLLFEQRIPDVRPPYTEMRYPSLLAHALSSQLVHSVFVLPGATGKQEPALAPKLSPTTAPLPCELHLLNLRLLQNKDSSPELKFVPPGTAALLVHHQAADCSFPAQFLNCSPNSGKFSIQQLFQDFTVPEATAVTLTLLNDLISLSPSSEQQIPQMEIQAYRIRLK